MSMSTQQATLGTTPYGRGNPPPPLVAKPLKHPVRWSKNTVWTFITGAVVTYFCVLIVVAIYYDVFETTATMTTWWHSFIPNSTFRHAVRDVGEGLLGGLGGVFAVRNRYKALKPPNRLDRFEMRMHIPNINDDVRSPLWWVVAIVPLVLLYAVIGFLLAFGLVELVQHFVRLNELVPSPGAHLSLQDKLLATFASAWPNKLMGYAAAFFFGRRPAKAVFDDLQLWLCEQRALRDQYLVSSGKWYHRFYPRQILSRMQARTADSAAPWYYPPTWKATFNDVKSTGATEAKLHGTLPVIFIKCLMTVAVVLVLQGWYIMLFIAN
jgi:hypothetical protein